MEKNLNIVLVHGAFGDGSLWRYVIPPLVSKGYTVRAVQLPLTSLNDDIKRTGDLVDWLNGPTLLVGHCYGGMVITGAGNNANVVGLVYISAFAPDYGETFGGLLQLLGAPAGASSIKPDPQGFLYVDYANFHEAFCQDVPTDDSLVMAVSQKPIHTRAFTDASGRPAWNEKPSWYQVSESDRMIQPETEAMFAHRIGAKQILRIDCSHVPMITYHKQICELILDAAAEMEEKQ